MKNIIIDGPDGCGKTTLCNHMSFVLDIPAYHLTWYKDVKKHKKQFDIAYEKMRIAEGIIFDRNIFSDKVYSNVYRDGTYVFSEEECDQFLKEIDLIIIALPYDKEKYLKQIKNLCNTREEMYNEKMDEIYDEYLKLYNQLLELSQTNKFNFKVKRYDMFSKDMQTYIPNILEKLNYE